VSRAAVLIGRLASDTVVFAVPAALLFGMATLLGFPVRTGLPDTAGIAAVAVTFGLSIAATLARAEDPKRRDSGTGAVLAVYSDRVHQLSVRPSLHSR
jgi:hypothetical protein